MQALIDMANRVKTLNVEALMRALVSDGYFRALIIDLNTQEQLFNQGIDSDGRKLRSAFARFGRVYAPFTIIQKEEKGQPTDRVTLKDEGEFYESFRVVLSGTDIEITADANKESGNLEDIWGPVIGLTDENLQRVIDYAREEIVIPFVLKVLYGEQ